MQTSRIIIESLSTEIEDLQECLRDFCVDLKNNLQNIDLNQAIVDRSTSLKKAIIESNKGIGTLNWAPKSRDGSAAFTLDATYKCLGKCQTAHFANLVIWLNNRETIGTNYLKLEMTALQSIRNSRDFEISDENVLGIFIAFDRDLLTNGGWDPAYADASEYSVAFKKYYRSLIKSNILTLRIHLT